MTSQGLLWHGTFLPRRSPRVVLLSVLRRSADSGRTCMSRSQHKHMHTLRCARRLLALRAKPSLKSGQNPKGAWSFFNSFRISSWLDLNSCTSQSKGTSTSLLSGSDASTCTQLRYRSLTATSGPQGDHVASRCRLLFSRHGSGLRRRASVFGKAAEISSLISLNDQQTPLLNQKQSTTSLPMTKVSTSTWPNLIHISLLKC